MREVRLHCTISSWEEGRAYPLKSQRSAGLQIKFVNSVIETLPPNEPVWLFQSGRSMVTPQFFVYFATQKI